MRTFDLTPFYRTTVGFDRLFDLLDRSSGHDVGAVKGFGFLHDHRAYAASRPAQD